MPSRGPECPGCLRERRFRVLDAALVALLVLCSPLACSVVFFAVDPGPVGDDHGSIGPCDEALRAGVCCLPQDLPRTMKNPPPEECERRRQAFRQRIWETFYTHQRAARRTLRMLAAGLVVVASVVTAARLRRVTFAARTVGHTYRASSLDLRCPRHRGGSGDASHA